MNAKELLKEIECDNISGAVELAQKAIRYLTVFSDSLDSEDPSIYQENMIEIGRQVIDAQPSMAPLFNVVNCVLFQVEEGVKRGSSVAELKIKIKSVLEGLQKEYENSLIKIQKHFINIIKDGSTIMTHSYSSTTIKSLIFAHREGIKMNVMVTESRPLYEGRRTAQILAENGIKTVLIADMASFYYLSDIDLILTGCDCICQEGIVNKIGTKGLAIAASQFDIPYYIVSEKSKFLPSKYLHQPKIDERESDEIFENPGNIQVKNIYFDITPLRFVKDVITEEGVLNTQDVPGLLDKMEVFESLIVR